MTKGAAGYDLVATEVTIDKGHNLIIYKTGVSIQLPKKTMGLIVPRSSIRKQGLFALANSVGVVDQDYQGEIQVTFRALSDDWFSDQRPYEIGDRIAQLIVVPILTPKIKQVTEFEEETERGTGGHGSTGTKKKTKGKK